MSLIENDLFQGKIDKVKIAAMRLQAFEPSEGYYLAFSGGKDSIVIKKLAEIAGVKFDSHYSVTTIDPPELIYFIRKYHSDVIWEHPDRPFLKVLETRGFPRRQSRWCCAVYKENGGTGRFVITGVRKEESQKRAGRRMVEICIKDKTKKFMNVIIDWPKSDVWEFIRKYRLPYCKLYSEGFKRIGCLFCPMQYHTRRKRELILYPRQADLFKKAFIKLYENRKKNGAESVNRWRNGEEMFNWWISDNEEKYNPDQTVMFE